MSKLTFERLLEAGVHFGHLKRKWNPAMAPYIFEEKKGIHIIDLNKTIVHLEQASAAMKQIAKSGKKVLFVATKKQAKEIIIEEMNNPPGLQELADQVGLNLKKLKMGFKQIYGDTVYGFLFDYKMECARKLLDSGSYNVNEVGLKIGYSTGSHFIAAFKKKFATTPKKYLMAINPNT